MMRRYILILPIYVLLISHETSLRGYKIIKNNTNEHHFLKHKARKSPIEKPKLLASEKYNKAMDVDNYDQKYTDATNKNHLVNHTLERPRQIKFNTFFQEIQVTKCNLTKAPTEKENFHNKNFDSIYLNNIHAGFTSSLIEDAVSISEIEESGVNLYDIVDSECGGAEVCSGSIEAWKKNSLIIGFLGAYAWSQTLLGAVPLAVAAINREKTLLPGHRLRFLTADVGRPRAPLPLDRDSFILRVMTQMRDLGVVAFFGLDRTCHTEAKVAAAWNLPLISHKCVGANGASKGNETLGATFARTLPPAHKVSKSVISLMKRFGWNKFAIVAGDAPTAAAQQMDAIKELAATNGMVITVEHRFSYYLPHHKSVMESIVRDTYDKTRIYVFLGENIALLDFVDALHHRGLLESGEYAVVAIDDEIFDPEKPRFIDADHLGDNVTQHQNIERYRAVLKLTPSFPTNPHYADLCEMIRGLSAAPPFCVPNFHKIFNSVSVPIEAAHLYDAITLWARAATAAMRAGIPVSQGATLMQLLRPTTYKSVQGFDINMDAAGDAEGNFTVIGLAADGQGNWSVQPVASFRYANTSAYLPELVTSPLLSWLINSPPKAEPECGFDYSKCQMSQDPGVLMAIAAAASAAILGVALLVRHYRYEQKLASVLWKIEAKDLKFIQINENDQSSNPNDLNPRRAHTSIAFHKGNIVAVKLLRKKSIDVTRAIRKELKQIRDIRHENLNSFVGVCIDSGSACIVTAYCSRGSLARVLADADLHLDDMFVASLVADLLRGLIYLHDTAMMPHGNLTSSNCLVDSRWVLQISDFGLHNLKIGCSEAEDALLMERRMLWRAPELLRNPNPPPGGTIKGDLYSFGIILYEIIGRNGPWGAINLTNTEIIGRVRQPIGGVIFRPSLRNIKARPSVLGVLNECWAENPEKRPELKLVRIRLKDMHAGMKTNIFDNMLAMMEKYASNLEGVVAARTEQLMNEKRRTDDLLHRMLPRTVAEALKRGEPVKAESFDCVTIYFSDIVGFTRLAAAYTPMQVVEILNDLYTCLDEVISYYNVYKVETIGDGYMVVGGLPERCSRHAAEIASMALHVLDAVPQIELRTDPPPKLQIRIGLHSGQCAAGVVGIKMPRYCLFGDAVNTAARMESSGESQRIHVSNDTYKLLKKRGYRFKERGIVHIKGKGDMRTWWLIGEDHERRTTPIYNHQQTVPEALRNDFDRSRWVEPKNSVNNIRDRARLSVGSSNGPASVLSSPGAPACACFIPPRDHHSAPSVSFCHD